MNCLHVKLATLTTTLITFRLKMNRPHKGKTLISLLNILSYCSNQNQQKWQLSDRNPCSSTAAVKIKTEVHILPAIQECQISSWYWFSTIWWFHFQLSVASAQNYWHCLLYMVYVCRHTSKIFWKVNINMFIYFWKKNDKINLNL